MQVRATKDLYYNHIYRKAGEEFELKPVDGFIGNQPHLKPKHFTVEDQFSDFCMEKVGEEVVRPKAKVSPKKTVKASEEVI